MRSYPLPTKETTMLKKTVLAVVAIITAGFVTKLVVARVHAEA